MNIEERVVSSVRDYIADRALLRMGARYVVGLSGGADSVTLLIILRELGYDVHAAHCHFGLRGEESDRDESFCVDLCRRLGVELHRVHFDTRTYSSLHGVSIEMAARELRYRYFSSLVADVEALGVCVAHHRDDSVETVLMNLLRGTGIEGLRGIRPSAMLGSLRVIRPLLTLSHADILAFLQARGQAFVVDSTNLDPSSALRNRVRLQLLPLMNEMVSGATAAIARTSDHLQQASVVVEASLSQSRSECFQEVGEANSKSFPFISIDALRRQPSAEYVLFDILKDYGFSSAQVSAISRHLDAPTGTIYSSSSHDVLFHHGQILIDRKPQGESLKPLLIPEAGTYCYGANNRFRITVGEAKEPEKSLPSSPFEVMYALKDVGELFPLTVRPLQRGDRFVPFGMNGSKLVSDFLTDCHRSLFHRRRQLVLTDASGTILWVVGERRAEGRRVSRETACVLKVVLMSDGEGVERSRS